MPKLHTKNHIKRVWKLHDLLDDINNLVLDVLTDIENGQSQSRHLKAAHKRASTLVFRLTKLREAHDDCSYDFLDL